MMTEGSYDWEEEDIQKKDSLNLNSLDCWDYTIELECLTGSQGKDFFFICSLKNYSS